VRDRQRSKVYAWEGSFIPDFHKNNLSEDNCVKMFDQLQKGFNSSDDRNMKLSLRFINGHGRCWHSPSRREIVLRFNWGLSRQVLLHEYAHALTSEKYESHGGEFVANYSVLLHLFHPKHPSFKELAQSLRDANVDWSDFKSSLAWKVFRRRKIKIAEAA